ncbi:MAG: hypothetical protein ACYDGN_16665 [Acidimicrobiales bacterium]
MIPAQLPADRHHWPAGVLDDLRRFRQGDVVADLPYFYWGNPHRSVLALTARYADEGEGVIEAANRFDYGLIATQTCDIVEEDSSRPGQPWVHICPVYDAERTYRPEGIAPDTPASDLPKLIAGQERSLIRQGRSQRYLQVPAIPTTGFWVADLRLLLPVEKGWLAGRERIEAFQTEADRIVVGRRLAWLYDRPAFDGRFVRTIQQPLLDALRVLRRQNRTMFDRLADQVPEIGVSTDHNIAIHAAEVVVLCNTAPDADITEWFHDWWMSSAETAAAEELTLLPLRVEQLDRLPASEYRRLTRLPLAAVSPNPAWYGEDPYRLDL